MNDASDEELARRANQADQSALEILFIRHQAHLRAMIAGRVANRDDVQDIIQDAFVDLLRGLHSYDGSRPFLPWMRVICRNRMFRHFKQQQKHRAATNELDALLAPEMTAHNSTEEISALQACIEALGNTAATLIRARYVDSLPVADLAAEAGSNSNAMMVRLHRLRAKLKACLRAKGLPA